MIKAIPLILSILFLFSSCGIYLLQLNQLQECSFHVPPLKKGNPALLVLISGVHSFERNGSLEVNYKNCMFDIVKEEHVSGKTMLYIIHDEREDHILSAIKNQIETLYNGFAKNNSNSNRAVVKTIDKNFTPVTSLFSTWSSRSRLLIASEHDHRLSSVFIPCVIPPPRG